MLLNINMPYCIGEFFKKYHVSEEDFKRSGFSWNELLEIRLDYISHRNEYGLLANYIAECFAELKDVHSIKKRVKDPWHLVRKLIWKKASNPEIAVHSGNYREIITDLIGVRVMHLFKDDWQKIHRDIMDKWLLKESPVANIRQGDGGKMVELYKKLGLEIKEHGFGYRSIHYQIIQLYNKKYFTAEIQVRTLFEEAWSEIDHKYRYPGNSTDPLMTEYLVLFNRLAGSADEMGSFIRTLNSLLVRQPKGRQEGKNSDFGTDVEKLIRTTGKLLT